MSKGLNDYATGNETPGFSGVNSIESDSTSGNPFASGETISMLQNYPRTVNFTVNPDLAGHNYNLCVYSNGGLDGDFSIKTVQAGQAQSYSPGYPGRYIIQMWDPAGTDPKVYELIFNLDLQVNFRQDLEDSEFVPPTFQNNWVNFDTVRPLTVRNILDNLHVFGTIKNTAGGQPTTTICKLPYEPKFSVVAPARVASSGDALFAEMTANTDGTLNISKWPTVGNASYVHVNMLIPLRVGTETTWPLENF